MTFTEWLSLVVRIDVPRLLAFRRLGRSPRTGPPRLIASPPSCCPFHKVDDPLLFAREKEQLENAAGVRALGGRQHYLRFKVPDTWHCWEQAGLDHDSSPGYADHEGFRAGTCWRFRPFDAAADREIRIWDEPLIVMDVTLRFYRGLTPETGMQSILKLAGNAKRVGGVFTLLWHNWSLSDSWKPWGRIYSSILGKLSQMMSMSRD